VTTAQDPAPGRSQWAAEVTVMPSLAADLIRADDGRPALLREATAGLRRVAA
jgi:hypothetical protein